MFSENTTHHPLGAYVVSGLEPNADAIMKVKSYTLDGRVRCVYVDPKRQRRFNVDGFSTLVVELRHLYSPLTFEIPTPDLQEGSELWLAALRR